MASKSAASSVVAENVRLGTGSLVCVKHVQLTGDITIGENTIINPRVCLLATNGPIVVANRVLIEDRALIENVSTDPLIIGDGSIIECDAVIKACVGAGAVVEMKATVLSAVNAGSVIGVACIYRRPVNTTGDAVQSTGREYVSACPMESQMMPASQPSTTAMFDLTRKHLRAYQEVYQPFSRP